jgi:hypothetical protein
MVNGGRCKREAEADSVVCRLHGGAAPQVRKRAAERLIMSADHASQKLLEWLDDPEVPYRVRAEIARDMLDRAGLAAAQLHKIIPVDADPVLAFFEGILEQDGLTALDPQPEQPRELESGDLDMYGQDPYDDEEDHEDAESAEVITMPETEPEPERQHSDTPPRLFSPKVAPSRRRPR